MWTDSAGRLARRRAVAGAAALLVALLASGCAPQLYQRSTVSLDHADLDQFRIRYAEFDGCLLRQQVPVDYSLERPA